MTRDSLVSVSYTACVSICLCMNCGKGRDSLVGTSYTACFYIMFVYELWEGEGFSSQCKLHSMFLYNVCV